MLANQLLIANDTVYLENRNHFHQYLGDVLNSPYMILFPPKSINLCPPSHRNHTGKALEVSL